MIHTAIALGYTNVCSADVESALRKEFKGENFVVFAGAETGEKPLEYEPGKSMARKLAALAYAKHRAPFCIGIVCVHLPRPSEDLRIPKVDIALSMEEGKIQEDDIPLSPHCCHKEMGLPPKALGLQEFLFSREACLNLVEYLKVRRRSRLLRHF